jgi:hypothetical protein
MRGTVTYAGQGHRRETVFQSFCDARVMYGKSVTYAKDQ